jgi:hypothetical protein
MIDATFVFSRQDARTMASATCKTCRGTGRCMSCHGSGYRDAAIDQARDVCPTCFGDGRCGACGGVVATPPQQETPGQLHCTPPNNASQQCGRGPINP